MIAAIAATAAGWLCLYFALRAGPRLGRAGGPASHGGHRTEPPAVVSLIAGRDARDGYKATLLDLAARGWFRLSQPAGLANPGPDATSYPLAAPVMCVLPAESPIEELTPYERRALTHLAQRAGERGEVPADALSDGFEGGEEPFMKAFRSEVLADARARGLTRPAISRGRKILLCVLAVVPAGTALLAAGIGGKSASLDVFCAVYFVFLCQLAAREDGERLTRAGQAALAEWRALTQGDASAQASGSGAAHSAAVGTAPAALATFASRGKNIAWSSYGEDWRQVTTGDPGERTWPGSAGLLALVCIIAVPGIPLLAVLGYLLAGGADGAVFGVVTGIAVETVLISGAVARWTRVPDFTEFDGQVIRQWETTDGEGGTTRYVAIDDGIRPKAWSFIVNDGAFRQLTPGTPVHAQVNPRRNKLLSAQTFARPPVAPQLAEVVAAQKRAARGGLPDPACLVTAADAAEILACPVRRCFRDSGRVAEWRPVSARHPVVLVEVNEADTPARDGRQVLGLDAYLLDHASTALAYEGATRARIAITGLAPADAEASLLRLLPRVTERLKNAAP